ENAEVTNVFKVVQDAISSVPPAYLNLQDLNGTEANITDIFEVRGSPNWKNSVDDTTVSNYNGYPAWRYTTSRGDLNATIAIDNGVNPPVLHTEITVVNDATSLKFQKLNRLVGNALNNGTYTVDIDLQ
ncbi:hypothetical protein, partial [Hydrogenimonas sp.]